jgi:hypothetical protein
MALDYPKRQGFVLSHKSAVFAINGEEVRGIKSIEITPSIDGREGVYDNGPRALGFTRGQGTVEFTITWDYGHAREWAAGAGLTRGILMRSAFTISATYEELGVIRTVLVDGATFTSWPTSSEGTAAMEVALPGMAIDAQHDGESLFDTDV